MSDGSGDELPGTIGSEDQQPGVAAFRLGPAPGEPEAAPPDPDVPGVRWGVPMAIGAFLFGFLASGVFFETAAAATGSRDGLVAQLAGLAGLWLGLAGGPIIASRTTGTASVAADFGFTFRPRRDVPIGIVIGIAMQVFLVPAIHQLVDVLLSGRIDDQVEDLAGQPDGAGFLVRAVAIVLLAPLAEELFFRGLLLRSIQRRAGAAVAVVVSSALFALVHLNPAATQASNLFWFGALGAVGAVLAVLALWRGRLGPAIAAHVAFNAVAMVVHYLTS